MQYVEVTFGRVSKVDPVPDGVSVCVHKWTLSILVSLPTCVSLVASMVAGLFGSYTTVPSLDATIDMTTRPMPGVAGFVDGGGASSSKNPTQAYVLFAFAYVRAVSSTSLMVYAALVTSFPPLMYVNAGAINTSSRPMMPMTISNSSNVKALARLRCLARIE